MSFNNASLDNLRLEDKDSSSVDVEVRGPVLHIGDRSTESRANDALPRRLK